MKGLKSAVQKSGAEERDGSELTSAGGLTPDSYLTMSVARFLIAHCYANGCEINLETMGEACSRRRISTRTEGRRRPKR